MRVALWAVVVSIGCSGARARPPEPSDDLDLDSVTARRAAVPTDAGAPDMHIALAPDTDTDADGGASSGGARIDLDVRDASVPDVLRMIAAAARIGLVVPDDVKGTITLDVRRVTWRQAIQVIAELEGLSVHEADGVVTVTRP